MIARRLEVEVAGHPRDPQGALHLGVGSIIYSYALLCDACYIV